MVADVIEIVPRYPENRFGKNVHWRVTVRKIDNAEVTYYTS